MWKPGTAKPSPPSNNHEGTYQNTTTPMDVTSTKDDDTRPPNGSNTPKKKLSGATMGMRFMQRRGSQSDPTKKHPERKTQDTMQVDDDDLSGGESSDCDNKGDSTLPQVATASDMYGIKSNLVGRRSFGDFNKNVASTWESALHAYTDGKAGERAKKQHISDEELLRRYEQYVKGRGNSNNLGDEMDEVAAAAPIGNLDAKIKKKRRKSEGQRGGEKRKRS